MTLLQVISILAGVIMNFYEPPELKLKELYSCLKYV